MSFAGAISLWLRNSQDALAAPSSSELPGIRDWVGELHRRPRGTRHHLHMPSVEDRHNLALAVREGRCRNGHCCHRHQLLNLLGLQGHCSTDAVPCSVSTGNSADAGATSRSSQSAWRGDACLRSQAEPWQAAWPTDQPQLTTIRTATSSETTPLVHPPGGRHFCSGPRARPHRQYNVALASASREVRAWACRTETGPPAGREPPWNRCALSFALVYGPSAQSRALKGYRDPELHSGSLFGVPRSLHS